MKRLASLVVAALVFAAPALAADEPRGRDLGVPFTGTPGPLNAITDVPGVEVGHVTLISGSGKLQQGVGPVRTGVTAILPHGKTLPQEGVFAAWFSQNGNGEMTGTTWVEESGQMWGPVMITNTHSVGVVRDAVIAVDAPLLPHQLKRLARRATMGIARTGSVASDSSGDIFMAFSTANSGAGSPNGVPALKMIPNARITPFFQATVEATEEAIVNALVAAETMTGVDDRKVIALPHDRLVALLRKYNRLTRTHVR